MLSFGLLTPYSKHIYLIEGNRERFFKDIHLGIQNVQLETCLFTLLGASFFPINELKSFQIIIIGNFISVCKQIMFTSEQDVWKQVCAHSGFSFPLCPLLSICGAAHSLAFRLIPCMNMYCTHRRVPREHCDTLIHISEVFMCRFYKTILQYELFEWAPAKQKSQRYKEQLRNYHLSPICISKEPCAWKKQYFFHRLDWKWNKKMKKIPHRMSLE